MSKSSKKSLIPFIIISIVVIIVGSIYVFSKQNRSPKYDFVTVKRGDVFQEISVTGRVKNSEDVALAFEKSGRVSQIYFKVGDKVNINDALIILENSELLAQLAQVKAGVESAKSTKKQYEAALETQEAKLTELKKGTRPEEIKIEEVKLENTKIALEDAKKNLIDGLQNAYTKSDDVVRNKADQFFKNPKSSNPQIVFSANNFKLENDLNSQRFLLENILIFWQIDVNLILTSSDLKTYIKTTKNNLTQVKMFLDNTALALDGLNPDANLTQTTIDKWRTDISTARTNINSAISELSQAEKELNNKEAELLLQEHELALKKAGSTPEQISAKEAEVKQAEANIIAQDSEIKQAEANVRKITAEINKTILKAPINGIVSKVDVKQGEIIGPNIQIISVISESQFEIEANVPEADIAKIKPGDKAKITLDAYGNNETFDATVKMIAPAETIIEGVATYKVTLFFDKEDRRVKSGMTANIDILTAKAENVLYLPMKSIVSQNGEQIVRILNTLGSVENVKIETGLRGQNGNVEIREGVKEGNQVIISIKNRG